MSRDAIGLDIGGANLKAATASGTALSVPFELWRHPDRLAGDLVQLRQGLPPLPDVAVTMTGELCDCFPTKRDGVRHILAAVRQAFGTGTVRVWLTVGNLAPLEWVAEHDPLSAAAANWLALAAYVGRYAPQGPALVLDTGSTTTDVIPLLDGKPVPVGWTDTDRLRSGELVYTGVRRTPVCALLGEAVAAEWFATAHDVYVRLGWMPPAPDDRATADGRPMTVEHAHARLSRMLGGDPELTPLADTAALAEAAFARQRELITTAIRRVVSRLPGPPDAVIVAGSGEFLARRAWEQAAAATRPAQVVSVTDREGPARSEAACAYALAVLAAEASCRD